MTRPPKSESIQRLQKALNQMCELKEHTDPTTDFLQWYSDTEASIANTFGESSPHVERFRTPLLSFVGSQSSHTTAAQLMHDEFKAINEGVIVSVETPYTRALKSAASALKSMIDEIEEYWEDEDQTLDSSSTQRDEQKDRSKVFVVHGRDDGARQAVARFIEKLDLEPVILDEQADKGRTIIEKFEQEAEEVRFAVVLLTPDDEGRLQGETDLKHRARQNVIFELGYFAGFLGRSRVCALTKGDVEIPSDYDGVIYILLDDSGGWKLRLVKELKEAEFDVDANLAL